MSGKGSIETAFLKTPLRVNKLDASGRYDVAQQKLVLDAVTFDTREISAKAKANIGFAWKDGELEIRRRCGREECPDRHRGLVFPTRYLSKSHHTRPL